jgi:hypothetical protein
MPVARLFSFTLPKTAITIGVEVEGRAQYLTDPPGTRFDPGQLAHPAPPRPAELHDPVSVPLIALAWARSGDKGNKANIGVIARRADYFPYICRSLSEEVVAVRFAHFLEGKVERFVLPGPSALNFLLHEVLGGGGVASLRNDPQGKGYAQLLLEAPVEIPAALARRDHLI